MKIGIFGDSFADGSQRGQGAWFDQITGDHQIQAHGFVGSSVTYSAYKILRSGHHYDLNIWCVTVPVRVTTLVESSAGDHWWCHVNAFGSALEPIDAKAGPDAAAKGWVDGAVATSQQFIRDYWFWDFACLEAAALVGHVQGRVPNLLLIPCFEQPMDVGPRCLSQISRNEFLDLSRDLFYQRMSNDSRICHMSGENNRRLAQLVGRNLHPGVLPIDPDDFVKNK